MNFLKTNSSNIGAAIQMDKIIANLPFPFNAISNISWFSDDPSIPNLI